MKAQEQIQDSFSYKSLQEEDKEIEEALKTPFEIVMSILSNVAHKLQDISDPLEKEVEWVINVIHSKRLYSYQGLQNASKLKKNSMEMKSFLGYLDQCSETKTIIEGSSKKLFQTTKLKPLTRTFKMNHFLQKRAKSMIMKSEDRYCSEDGIFFETDSEIEENICEEYILNMPSDNISIHQQTNPPPHLIEEEKNDNCSNDSNELLLSSMTFNIFNYFEQYGDSAFEYGVYGILSNFSLEKYSSTEQIKSFINDVKHNYSKDAFYHNEMHGLDVLQTVFVYITNTSLAHDLCLNEIDLFSLVIGALVHDLGHGGYNNDFHIKTQSELAIRYNDKNVLENYHVSRTFELLKAKENNILEKIGREDYSLFRKRIIELILSTDMLLHSKLSALMKRHIDSEGKKVFPFNPDNLFEEQQEVLNFTLHTADISHCSKDFCISEKWTERINQEFWRQGDYEKEHNLTISFLCDRECANVPRSQIGFIKGIIMPSFDLLTLFFPELTYYKENVNNNLLKWGEMTKENCNEGKVNNIETK